MTKPKFDLTEGPLPRHLLSMTIPMLWGIGAVIAMQMASAFFIGQLDDTHKLAAVSFTFPVTMLVSNLVFGLNVAMSSVIARLLGQKRREDVRRVVTHGLMLAVLVAATLCGTLYLLIDPIFKLLGADPALMPDIRVFMTYWLIAQLFFAAPVVGNAALRADGDALTPAIVMTLMALINFILDPIFIFGMYGFPRMEVAGAGLAVLISDICLFAIGMYVLVIRRKLVCNPLRIMKEFGDSCKRLGHIAVPASLSNIIQPVTNNIIVSMIAAHGAAAVAAYGVVTRVESFAFLVVISMALASTPIIGQNWGAGQLDRVKATLRLTILFGILWTLVVAALIALFAKQIAGVFSADPAVILIASTYLIFIPVTQAFGNLTVTWGSAFNAMGKPNQAVLMIIVRMLVFTIPLAWTGHHLFGLWGIFGGVGLANILVGAGFHIRNRNLPFKREIAVNP